jgi:hypothetical protein
MVTNSIDFTATDKMTVVAGVRKLSSGAGIVLETSTTYNSNNGAIVLYTDTRANFGASGTGGNAVMSSVYASPVTHVISGLADRAGTTGPTTFTRLGINSVDDRQSYSYANNDSGNFGNYPLYLFRRGGTNTPFNGRFYGMTIVNKLLSTTELTQLETYTNNKTRAYVPPPPVTVSALLLENSDKLLLEDGSLILLEA